MLYVQLSIGSLGLIVLFRTFHMAARERATKRLQYAMIYDALTAICLQFPFNSSCLPNIRECLSTSSITPLIPSFSASSFISFPSLNFNCKTLGSLEALGNNLVLIFIVCRELGGMKERNRRAVFALGEKGLKTVDTSVMNLVIILN